MGQFDYLITQVVQVHFLLLYLAILSEEGFKFKPIENNSYWPERSEENRPNKLQRPSQMSV